MFGKNNSNAHVYTQTAKKLIPGVLSGLNGTVFAYGATGSGKTYTMVGDTKDPGMMVLSSTDVFDGVRMESTQFNFTVTCSYLEEYNELIYDLLEVDDNAKPLELRDDPTLGAVVSGLKKVKVTDGDDVVILLNKATSDGKRNPPRRTR